MALKMNDVFKNFYKFFSIYANVRQCPSITDGLKPVERRVLYTSFLIAKDKLVKSNKIDGTCTANFHPHGDCYGTIVQLANRGFLRKQGNFGTSVGIEPSGPSAKRYTESGLNELSRGFFEFIKNVPFEIDETEDEQPVFLPVKYPICFIGEKETSGFGSGYRTDIPIFKVDDLNKRLKWLLNGSKGRPPIIKPVVEFDILSDDSVISELLTKGIAKIEVEGRYKIDHKNQKINIYSWEGSFSTIYSKIQKNIPDVGYIDLSKDTTNVEISINRQRGKEEKFNQLVENIENGALKADLTYRINVIDENKNVRLISVDEYLLSVYNRYKKVVENMIHVKIEENLKQKIEYENLKKLRPYLSTHLKHIEKDTQETYAQLSSSSGVSVGEISYLFSKYRISRLFNLNLDISSYDNEIKEWNEKIKNIDSYVWSQYE